MFCFLVLVVSTSAIDCLERHVSEMTNYVSSQMLNHIHSVSHSLTGCVLQKTLRKIYRNVCIVLCIGIMYVFFMCAYQCVHSMRVFYVSIIIVMCVQLSWFVVTLLLFNYRVYCRGAIRALEPGYSCYIICYKCSLVMRFQTNKPDDVA